MIGAIPSIPPVGSGTSAEQIRQVLGLTPRKEEGNGDQVERVEEIPKTRRVEGTENLQGNNTKSQSSETGTKGLGEQQKGEVAKLKTMDREVRAHEQSHMAAGGTLVSSGANYEYRTGPDGNRYAVGGEVSIDTAPVKGDPQATIIKEQRVIRAALAPAEPSPQDQRVASAAAKLIMDARLELIQEKYNQGSDGQEPATPTKNVTA